MGHHSVATALWFMEFNQLPVPWVPPLLFNCASPLIPNAAASHSRKQVGCGVCLGSIGGALHASSVRSKRFERAAEQRGREGCAVSHQRGAPPMVADRYATSLLPLPPSLPAHQPVPWPRQSAMKLLLTLLTIPWPCQWPMHPWQLPTMSSPRWAPAAMTPWHQPVCA